MHRTLEFLLHHGYILLLGWVFAEQIGLPVPSMPLLLAAGALAGTGHLNFFASLFYVIFAAVSADSIWYQLGRRKGIRILQLLCKISLEPDSCVRRTEGVFSKQGARSLLLAKFLPGLSTVAPPLAGIFHMRPRRFLLFDAAGSLLWAGSFLGLGYIFSGEIERIAEHLAALGGWLLVLLLGILGGLVADWWRGSILRSHQQRDQDRQTANGSPAKKLSITFHFQPSRSRAGNQNLCRRAGASNFQPSRAQLQVPLDNAP